MCGMACWRAVHRKVYKDNAKYGYHLSPSLSGCFVDDYPIYPKTRDDANIIFRLNRLDDVAVGSQIITAFHIGIFCRRCENDHGDGTSPGVRFYLTQDFYAIYLGHLQVEEHNTGNEFRIPIGILSVGEQEVECLC